MSFVFWGIDGIVFKEEDLEACLDRAKEIRELYEMYVLHGNVYPKSIDKLIWLISQYLEKEVVIRYVDVPAEGSSVKAAFWAMDDGTYQIALLTGMSDDEVRFVLCKELFHVIFDEESRRYISLFAHIEEVTSTFPLEEGHPNCAASWELLAEIAATEFLFPYGDRLKAVTTGEPTDYARVASKYGVPRFIVEVYCGPQNLTYIGKRIR